MRAFYVLLLTAFCCAVFASPAGFLEGIRANTPPKIDGAIGDGEWGPEPSGTGLVDAETAQPEPYATRFWITYDDRFIYFAAELSDPAPKRVRADEYRTNASLSGNDTVGLILDTFGSLADFNEFAMNASGGTSITIAGGRAAKREWLGEIQAKGQITETGWVVESRIPWEIMKLPAEGKRNLRFNVTRYLSSNQRDYRWRDTRGTRIDNMAYWANVQVPPADRRRAIKMLPFGYLGYEEGDGLVLDGGLDAKTSITDQIEAVASFRPDFRNIENEVLSLDFSYFERLASESRPFFMEGAETFFVGYDQKIFASQRVDSFDLGFKTYGKLGEKTTFGAMDLATFGDENVFVASGAHQFDADTKFRLSTVVLNGPMHDNTSGVAQINKNFGPVSWYLGSMFAEDEEQGFGHRTNIGGSYSANGLELNSEYVEVSPDFYPRVGYSPEQNLRGFNWYGEYARPTTRWGLVELGLSTAGVDYRNFDGDRYRRYAQIATSATWANGIDLDLSYTKGRFLNYDDESFRISIEQPRREPYRRWQFDATTGKQSGLDYDSIAVSFAYRPWNRLQLTGRYQCVDHAETFEQIVVGATYDIGNDQSVSGRLVLQDGDINGYLAYRKSGNRGTEYFMILGDPNSRTFQDRLILKVTVPFDLFY